MLDEGFELLVRTDDGDEHVADVLSGDDPLTFEEILDLLGNQRRRYVLHYLCEHEETVVHSLVTHVARRENPGPDSPLAPTQQERLRVEIMHAHLPKLADAGLVEFDETGERVELSTASPSIRLVLELAAVVESN